MTKRVLFYVQHLLGIGHLARASLICKGLVGQGFEVKMVMGGTPIDGFPGKGVDVVHLPELKAGSCHFNELTTAEGVIADENFLNNRRDQLLALFDDFQPDILVIEAFPFGRRQMRFELSPLLEKTKQVARPMLVAGSVRDIVQENKKPKRLRETTDTLQQYFDLLLVHGDPQFMKLDVTFDLASEINNLIEYTGIVSSEIPPLTGQQYDVVVSAGGGAAGDVIMLNGLQAIKQTSLANASWCFITGPNLSKQACKHLKDNKPDNVTIESHRTDFRAMLAVAKLSISQAGYNTTADILRAKVPSVLVPFSTGGETEQTRRADRLSELELAVSVSETGINSQILAKAVEEVLQQENLRKPEIKIDLEGAIHSAHILKEKFAAIVD